MNDVDGVVGVRIVFGANVANSGARFDEDDADVDLEDEVEVEGFDSLTNRDDDEDEIGGNREAGEEVDDDDDVDENDENDGTDVDDVDAAANSGFISDTSSATRLSPLVRSPEMP